MLAKTQLKNVHRVTSRGKVYFYHRWTRQRITSEPDTPEFVAEVERMNRRAAPTTNARTLGKLIKAYQQSPEFNDLRMSTQLNYGWHLNYLMGIGDTPVRAIDVPYCLELRNIVYRTHKRVKANMVLTVLGIVWRWGLLHGLTKGESPTGSVPRIKRPKSKPKQNRAWTDAEFDLFVTHASPSMRVAATLARYTALREADVLNLRWSQYDGEALLVAQGKTGDEVWLPVHPVVKDLLDRLPRRHARIVVTHTGRPFNVKTFPTAFHSQKSRLLDKGFPEGLTFHGLRTTAAVRVANEGDERDVMSITGHRDSKSVRPYVEEADRRRRATRAVGHL